MTNPTSYTDEQVLSVIQTCDAMYLAEVSNMLRSLLADRQRLQAEVEAHSSRLEWVSHAWGGKRNDYATHVLRRGGDGDLSDICTFIDAARATPNETKEAKS